MSTGTIVAIIVVVIVVAALIAVASLGARRRRLRERFGPEYDRAVEGSDSKLKAESELAGREKRAKHLDIRPLDAAAQDRYARQWTAIQEQFVDDPVRAVTDAHSLITSVMNDRGYPTENAAQIMADLSVKHASTLENYRTAKDFSSRAADGMASTEDLRQAMVHYRTLFRDLLGDPAGMADAGVPATEEPVGGYVNSAGPVDATEASATQQRVAEPIVAQPTVADPAVPPGAAEPELSYPDPGPRDAAELPAASDRPASSVAASMGRTDTMPVDAVPADSAPAHSYPASTAESEAEQAGETSAAAAARLQQRR
jgi:hypothetical protein